ncbi:efflux RND transporter permease subunit [Aestuariibacter halophilus]|uniref:Efflux RND transporter permease subunit n=1 Tax=Fluctibacter halophilus TaxID=226011 RepID=A0ABS8G5R0_9ALTE|nr:efflux RND transporter permease subunit [Aestuariibacter halophilus]MCC2615441.1 efflux RND transporter permease subunit [Aestuariibacter halophilus]
MDITRTAIKNATGIGIVVAIIAVLGLYSLFNLPVQLFPDIERPTISVQTSWRAASPQEIESEILEPQEEVLQGLPGLQSMRAFANQGNAWINLEFGLETDMQKTLIEVISRMNRIPPLPRDALSPNIMLGGWGGGTPALTYFFLQKLPGNPNPINSYVTYFEDAVRPQLESIPGVARVRMESGVGGAEEFQIVFDPYRAAELGVDLTNITRMLGSANDVSGGFVEVGRRRYTMRFEGKYEPQEMGEMILEWRDGSPVKLSDIADIRIQRADGSNFSVQNGNPAISIRIDRENSANVLSTLEAVKAKVEELNQSVLADEQLTMAQSFDASVFIYRAINLVTSNLMIGVLLAVGILWWFMRQARATLIVALAIPISLLSTFVVLQITGRSLNVISLAGLAFAVGMVLDAAIVVLENIVRQRKHTPDSHEAAHIATKQVFGALMASTATTVAIFIPVMFLNDVEGQLFADLALTIAIAVSFSFLVAVTVLPVVASRWLQKSLPADRLEGVWERIASGVMKLSQTTRRRIAIIALMMSIPVAASYLLMPKLDYLPPVKRDAIDAFFNFPAGASEQFIEQEVMSLVVERLKPYMAGEKEPALKNYYIITWPNGGTIGVRAKDQEDVRALETLVRDEILKDLPDTQAFAMQGNLFGGFGNGRSIDLRLQATDQEGLTAAAQRGLDLLRENFPGANVRANPNLEQAEPELQFYPNDARIMEVGYDRARVANLIRAMGDGMYVGEYFDGIKRMNIIFRTQDWQDPEQLAVTPILTPSGEMVQLGELVRVERAVGPSQIQRVDRRRTLSLNLNPPEGMSLEEAMTIIREKVEPGIQAVMPPDGAINYGGSADSLNTAIATMSQNFLFAMGLLLVLMAGLFRSIKDSLLVILSIPLATVGGIIAIRLLNLVTFQPMDLLTMIGFIILLGLVVNNAILLVHQTRLGEGEGLSRREAVHQALLLRLRPIFMSTLTSIFGMLPLLLLPGAGSVIYRGLAAVIVGGMTVSTIFTLVLLPTLLQIEGLGLRKTRSARAGNGVPTELATQKMQKLHDNA